MRGAGGTAPFFWQFVNGTHGTVDCLKRVVPLVTPAFSTRSSLCFWRHSLPLFYFLRASEPDRYALPKLSDPLLLKGACLEEGEWVE